MKILAVIPARGGSKGIKRKNIVDLHGKPLIHYTLKEATSVKRLSRVFVSTDCAEIKSVCDDLSFEVPFLRPKEHSGDSSRTVDAVIDVLNTLKEKYNEEYDFVCLLQPTTPLRLASDIDACIDILLDKKEGSVVSLSKVDEPHPYKMKIIKDDIVLPLMEGRNSSIPRQELPPVYELNGAVYLTDVETIFTKKSFFHEKTHPYIMPRERSVNINNDYDLKLAEIILSNSDEKK